MPIAFRFQRLEIIVLIALVSLVYFKSLRCHQAVARRKAEYQSTIYIIHFPN